MAGILPARAEKQKPRRREAVGAPENILDLSWMSHDRRIFIVR
jgi:hypothetical protein